MIEINIQKQLKGSNAGGNMALNVVIDLPIGQVISVFGPSGAGKTTLLKVLAGLIKPDSGRLVVNGEVWYDSAKRICLPSQKRQVSLVFQEYALFPNMTIHENLAYAQGKRGNKALISQLIDRVGLKGLETRKPNTLSGGQQQRVALARAMIRKPKLLLLDEPLSAIDTQTRFNLQQLIIDLHRSYGTTTLLVSHDVSEVMRMAQHMVKLVEGSIKQQGTPEQLLLQQSISGKFKITGVVVAIRPQGFLSIVSVLAGNDMISVAAEAEEIEGLAVGDQVLVASKAFNPIIKKVD